METVQQVLVAVDRLCVWLVGLFALWLTPVATPVAPPVTPARITVYGADGVHVLRAVA